VSASPFWPFVAAVLGFLSRPCCSIPFFLSLAGLGSSSLVRVLQPYRFLFLAGGLILFTTSAYYTFRVRGALFNKILFVASLSASAIFILLRYL